MPDQARKDRSRAQLPRKEVTEIERQTQRVHEHVVSCPVNCAGQNRLATSTGSGQDHEQRQCRHPPYDQVLHEKQPRLRIIDKQRGKLRPVVPNAQACRFEKGAERYDHQRGDSSGSNRLDQQSSGLHDLQGFKVNHSICFACRFPESAGKGLCHRSNTRSSPLVAV